MANHNPKIRIKQFNAEESLLLETALSIRTIVFIDGQNVPSYLEHDGLEHNSAHYLLYVDNHACGTARWRNTEKGIKLERFAILEQFRNMGYGEILLRKVLDDVIPLQKPIYLHAQSDAVNLYLRNGFKITSAEFEEAGIKHFLMEYF